MNGDIQFLRRLSNLFFIQLVQVKGIKLHPDALIPMNQQMIGQRTGSANVLGGRRHHGDHDYFHKIISF